MENCENFLAVLQIHRERGKIFILRKSISFVFYMFQSSESSENFTEFDGYIDMGKEMSILHTVLTDTLERATEVHNMLGHSIN